MKSKRAIITENFYKFEITHNLFDKKINDIYFWDVARWSILQEIVSKKGVIDKPHDGIKKSFLSYLKTLPWILRGLTINNPFLINHRKFLIIGHARRKKGFDNLWLDLFSDPIIDNDIFKNYVLIEKPYQNYHLIPAKTKSIKYLDLFIFPYIIAKLFGRLLISTSDIKKIHKLEHQLSDEFQTHIDLVNKLSYFYGQQAFVKPLIKILYKIVAPEALILSVYYCNPLFIIAAKELNIPVVELQHGIISYYHCAYHYPKINRKSFFTPNYILSFGSYWKKQISLPVDNNNIYEVGYPYFEMEKKQYLKHKRRKQILFISQGTMGRQMATFVANAKDEINPKYKIIFKLHPGEFKRAYQILETNNIEVVRDEVPLYQLLAESEIVVGVNSTAIFEAMGMGVPKIGILNWEGKEYVDQLLKLNNVKLIDNVNDLLLLCKTHIKINGLDLDQFFKKNSIENIKNVVSKIIN
mgnify:CR=1 FL=1